MMGVDVICVQLSRINTSQQKVDGNILFSVEGDTTNCLRSFARICRSGLACCSVYSLVVQCAFALAVELSAALV